MEFDKSLTKSIPCIMFWEEEPLPGGKHRLVEAGVKVVVFNPCGNKPDSGDFISTMEQNVSGLALILGE
jgi:zinc transport system substrate-binding protein